MSGFSTIATSFGFLIEKSRIYPLIHGLSYIVFFIGAFTAPINAQTPSYSWEKPYDLLNADIGSTYNLVIAIDTDSQGNVYYLTFGAGVHKINPSTGTTELIINDLPEEAGNLNAPLDMVIDNNDIIYIADSGSKLIKKFDLAGVSKGAIGSGSGGDGKDEFWEPTGMALDKENNLFIVDAYRGEDTDVTKRYFLKIYYSSGQFTSFQGTTDYPLFQPYRVGVNDEYIIISHAKNDGEVLVFTKTLEYVKTLSDIGSPGSVVIDNNDYIHIIDYGDNIDFSKVLDFEKLEILDYLQLYNGINSGIEDEEMMVQIYDPQLNHISTFNDPPDQDNIQFPVDLAFDDCSYLFMDDGSISGLSIDFKLEIFEKSPGNDIINPVANCVPSGKEFSLANGSVTITVDDIDNGSTDNCGIASKEVSPNTISTAGDHDVTLIVTDIAGNTHSCTTSIRVTGPETPLDITCPETQTGSLNANCEFKILDYTELVDSNGVITQDPVPGTFVSDDTTIKMTANLDGETETCEFQLKLIDNTPPEIECFTNITGTYDSTKGFELLDYTSQITVSDNCDSSPMVTQNPPAGSLIYADESKITFTAKDATGNISTCQVDVLLTDVPESLRFTSCPDIQVGELDANCEFIIPDYTLEAETNYPEAVITQEPLAGELLQGKASIQVILTATLGSETMTCPVPLTLVDVIRPDTVCPGDQTESYNPIDGFVIPDFSSLAQSNDNCGEITVTQDPVEGTVVFGDTPIQLHFRDTSANLSSCFFQLYLEEVTQPSFECPSTEDLPIVELNDECRVEPKDFDNLLSSFQGFENEPNVVQTAFQDGNILHVRLEVYDGEGGDFVDECNFEIPLVDTTPPQIDCPNNPINISPNENGRYILPDFSERASDSCDSNLDIFQDPPPGEITQSGSVSLSATDDSGNTSEICSFEVVLLPIGEPSFECPSSEELPILELDQNCLYEVPDFNSLFSNFQNFENSPLFVQNTEQLGSVLRAVIKVYDGEEKAERLVGTCEFHVTLIENYPPEASCRSAITVKLGQDGTRTISPEDVDNGSTDNCGGAFMSLSRDTFTTADLDDSPIEVVLTVADTFENTDTCTVAVSVEPYDPEEPQPIVCISSLTLPLDENGEAQIDVDQLYSGDLSPGGTVSVNKLRFTCEDLGQHTIFLNYTGDTAGDCTIIVNVVDEIAPVPVVANLEISLGGNGTASISPEDIDNGSTDNCSHSGLQYALSQTVFNCSDRGFNNLEFTVTDSSGNSASTQVIVTVNDPEENCLVAPEPPGETDFVQILPNPSRGLLQIAASPNIEIQRVEVFDVRARYMGTYELTLNPGTQSYSLDLQQYQTGVYTLRIIADDGEYIRRAIISTF